MVAAFVGVLVVVFSLAHVSPASGRFSLIEKREQTKVPPKPTATTSAVLTIVALRAEDEEETPREEVWPAWIPRDWTSERARSSAVASALGSPNEPPAAATAAEEEEDEEEERARASAEFERDPAMVWALARLLQDARDAWARIESQSGERASQHAAATRGRVRPRTAKKARVSLAPVR